MCATQLKLALLFLTLMLSLDSTSWASPMGVPYQYGDFNGVFNVRDERQSVYGDFNNDSHLDHAISDPRRNRVLVFMCNLGQRPEDPCGCTDDYWINLDRVNPPTHGIHEWDWLPELPTDRGPRCYKEILGSDFGSPSVAPYQFGSSLAVGDFDGDGYDDLVVGAPSSHVTPAGGAAEDYSGAAFLFLGGFEFFDARFTHSRVIYQGGAGPWGVVEDAPNRNDGFASSLAVGDFNCDGFDDLAIGTPGEDDGGIINTGLVQLFYGAPGLIFDRTTSIHQGLMRRQIAEANEFFGASLTSGRFNDEALGTNRCWSLAVGAPRQEVSGRRDAGEVYVFLAESGNILSPERYREINQARFNVHDEPEDMDMFSATLGTIQEYTQGYDGLWVGVRRQDSVRCTEPEHKPFHRFVAAFNGINTSNDYHYCGMFSPEVLEQRAVISEVMTPHGYVAFYMPSRNLGLGTSIEGGGALIHGTYGDWKGHVGYADGCSPDSPPLRRFAANEGVFNYLADLKRIALVIPKADHNHFGNHRECMRPWPWSAYSVSSGYRGTFGGVDRGEGQPWGFDEWLNYILDELAKINLAFVEPIYLYGHSAGGQFVSRYLWEHAERVRSAVISSPGSVLWPNSTKAWPAGMGVYDEEQNWPGWGPGRVRYDPADATVGGDLKGRWGEILSLVAVHVVVEELKGNPVCEDDPTPPICGPPPDEPYFVENKTKIDSLRNWVGELRDVLDTPTFCVVGMSDHGTVFDGKVLDASGNPILGFYFGDEAALSLFGYGVNRSGLCIEAIF